MGELIVALDERLGNVGDCLDHSAHVGWEDYSLGERVFTLDNGVDVDAVLTNAGEGILVTGIVRADVTAPCDRCLDDAHFTIAGELNEYFLFHEPEAGADLEDEDGPDFALVGADSTVDLEDAVRSALVMELPYVVLCREDCKGLCPVCGENLNHVDCGHARQIAEEEERERIANSPFAVLKGLDLGE